MNAVTVYTTDDGLMFNDPVEASAHEEFVRQIGMAMAGIGGIMPSDRIDANSEGYEQHDPNVVRIAWQLTLALFRNRTCGHSKAIQSLEGINCLYESGWVGRICEPRGAAGRAIWRFGAITPDGKEWGQPYYAMKYWKDKEDRAS